MQNITEEQARESATCLGCGKPKPAKLLVVCWHCFKYREDVTPLKFAGLSLEQWLSTLPKTQTEEKRARLNAAAPILLDACEVAIKWMECGSSAGRNNVIEYLRKAIDKAAKPVDERI